MPGGYRTGSYVEKGGATLITPGAGAPPSGPFSGGPFTAGSIIFAAGGFVLTENNPNFFFDTANVRMGIGNNTPTTDLNIRTANQNVQLWVDNTGVNPSGIAELRLRTLSAGGDSQIVFDVSDFPAGGWTIFNDNSDADTLKIADAGTRLSFTHLGSVVLGNAVLPTIATDGFLYISTSAGTPIGVPTAFAGRQPIHIDTTNNLLYFYSSGAWRSAASGGTVPTSRTLFGTDPIRIDGGASGDLSADRTISVLTFGAAQVGVVPASGGGTTNFLRADGTWAVPAGGVPAGTGVVYSSGGVLLNEPTVFFWDAPNDRLGIGTNAPSMDLEVRRAGVGVTPGLLAFNTDNTNASSSAQLWSQVGGTSAGDPIVRLTISGGEDFLIYLDNSDSDILKFNPVAGVAFNMDTNRNVAVGSAALATNAANGFLFISTSAGTPTGVPTAFAGRAPIHVDTTNNLLYFYSTGAWRSTGGAGGIITTDGTTTVNPTTTMSFDVTDGFDVVDSGGGTATINLNNFTSTVDGAVPASGGGTTNFLRADGSWVAPPGGASVPGAAGVVFTDAVTLLTDTGFQYDSATNRLLVSDTNTSPTADLHVRKSVSGGTVFETIENTNGGADSAAALILISTTSSGAGDSYVRFVRGATNFAIGMDVSDSNFVKFVGGTTPSATSAAMVIDNGSPGVAVGDIAAGSGGSGGFQLKVTRDNASSCSAHIENRNTSASANAFLQISSTGGGAGGGDPYIYFDIGGGTDYAMGTDTSDSDRWKLCASASGVSAGNEALQVGNLRDVYAGAGVLTTGATNGFFFIPTCAGTPTGGVTTLSAFAALVYDSTNNLLYANDGGGWVAV